MTSFGVEIAPNSTYTHYMDGRKETLYLSSATLGDGDGMEKTILKCIRTENKVRKAPYTLCSFIPGVIENAYLGLKFYEADDVNFLVKGPHSVFLTGYTQIHANTED